MGAKATVHDYQTLGQDEQLGGCVSHIHVVQTSESADDSSDNAAHSPDDSSEKQRNHALGGGFGRRRGSGRSYSGRLGTQTSQHGVDFLDLGSSITGGRTLREEITQQRTHSSVVHILLRLLRCGGGVAWGSDDHSGTIVTDRGGRPKLSTIIHITLGGIQRLLCCPAVLIVGIRLFVHHSSTSGDLTSGMNHSSGTRHSSQPILGHLRGGPQIGALRAAVRWAQHQPTVHQVTVLRSHQT